VMYRLSLTGLAVVGGGGGIRRVTPGCDVK